MTVGWIDRIRRNHALEHATVSRLLEKGTGLPPLGGYSFPRGFIVWGKASPDEVSAAAREALLLLKQGHTDLGVSPYCGTNIVAAAILGGLAAFITGRGRGLWPMIRGAAIGLIVAGTLSQPVGKLIQRRLTINADQSGIEIRSARVLKEAPVSIVWISTAHADSDI